MERTNPQRHIEKDEIHFTCQAGDLFITKNEDWITLNFPSIETQIIKNIPTIINNIDPEIDQNADFSFSTSSTFGFLVLVCFFFFAITVTYYTIV